MSESEKLVSYAGEHRLAKEEQALLDLQKVRADILIQAGVAGPKATTEDVMLKMEAGQEFGFRPLFALNKVAVVQGQVFLMGEALLALIKASPVFGGARYWWLDGEFNRHDVNEVPIRNADFFGYVVQFWRNDAEDRYTAQFTVADAKTAGLSDKDNWQKRRVVMCKWRAVGDAGRVTFPDVIGGIAISAEAEELGAEVMVTPEGDVRIIDASIQDSDELADEGEPVIDEALVAEANELGDLLGYSAVKIRSLVEKVGPEHIDNLLAEWREVAAVEDPQEVEDISHPNKDFGQPHNGSAEQLDLGGDDATS